MRIELHPEAEIELLEAASWYDGERSGLGEEFLQEMDRWMKTIAEAPFLWPRWPDSPEIDPMIRRVLTDRFPFAIAYQVETKRVLILAFAHTSRQPFYWARRSAF